MAYTMTAGRGKKWPAAIGLTALLVAALIGTFWETATSIVDVWGSSRTFNHGFFIPLISFWLIWSKRDALRAVSPRPSAAGLIVVLGGAAAWLTAEVSSVQVVQHFALVIMIQGAVLSVLGGAVYGILLFPMLYLFFGVPAGEFLIAPLQDFTAHFVVQFLRVLGIPVFMDGIFISIPTGNFEVAEACAGVRFLIATLAIGVLFAYLSYRSWVRRLVFVGLAIFIPIIANGLRAFGIILLAYYSNNRIAVGVDHIVYGWGFFAFILLLLLWVGSRFSDKPIASNSAEPPAGLEGERPATAFRMAIFAVLALLVAVSAPSYARYIGLRTVPADVTLSAPEIGNGWTALPRAENPFSWHPEFTGVDDEILRVFRKDDRHVALYVGYYSIQRQGAELIHRSNSIVGAAPWNRASSGTLSLPRQGRAAYERMISFADTAVVYYWYWVGDQLTASRYMAKLLHAVGVLFAREPSAAVVAIAVEGEGGADALAPVAHDFLAGLGGVEPYLRNVVAVPAEE